MSPAEPALEPGRGTVLSTGELRRVCDFLHRRTGLSYGESRRAYIERRVAQRVAGSGAGSFGAYMGLLRASPAEAERLINLFTVNETYFYREEHGFRALSRDILPEVVRARRPGDPVRIWSFPCATGEEPYSIALWLLENWPMVDAYNVEIVGSDIDTAVLAAARAGEYGERALARLPDPVRQRYFEPAGEAAGDRRWRIIGDLRESVRFTQANLVDAASAAGEGRFDVILCRNLLIYFDEASRTEAVRNLYRALHPGGFLLLGHTETVAPPSDHAPGRFATRRFPDAVAHQRPVDAPA